MRRTALAFAPVALALPFPLRCPSCRAVPCAVPPLPLLTRCGPFACQGVTLCTDVFIWHNCLQRRPSCCSTSSRTTSSRSYSPQGLRHAEYIQSELLATRSSARRVHPGAARHRVIGTQSTSSRNGAAYLLRTDTRQKLTFARSSSSRSTQLYIRRLLLLPRRRATQYRPRGHHGPLQVFRHRGGR